MRNKPERLEDEKTGGREICLKLQLNVFFAKLPTSREEGLGEAKNKLLF